MKRLVIFAAYSKDEKVHDYVLNYLKYLKQIAWKIIFIADNSASDAEKSKLRDFVDLCHFESHGEYDFGSYKRGFLNAQKCGWLENTDELILCNDSCFCVSPLKPIFEKMSDQKLDFWGINQSSEIRDHLQSFFLVFNKSVFLSNVFKNYLLSVTKESDFWQIVLKYEVPLKQLLEANNFKGGGFIRAWDHNNPTRFPLFLLHQGFPLLKKKVFYHSGFSRQSVTKTFSYLKKVNNDAAQDILNYFKSKNIYWIALKLFIKSLKI